MNSDNDIALGCNTDLMCVSCLLTDVLILQSFDHLFKVHGIYTQLIL